MTLVHEAMPKTEKFAYLTANIGQLLFQAVLDTFLLIFYTDVAGLNPAAVGTLLLVARVMDAFSDPLMGYILDHLPATRWGRFRPYLAIGGVLTGLNLWLLFAAPLFATSGKLVIAYLTYLVSGVLYDLLVIPLTALISVMSRDEDERTQVATMRGIGSLLGGILASVATIPLVNLFADERIGWMTVIGIFGIVIAAFAIFGAVSVKERVQFDNQETYQASEVFKLLLRNPPLLLYLLQHILRTSGYGMVTVALVFYFKYNVGNENLVGLGLMGLGLPMILLIPTAPVLARRFEKKWLLVIGMALGALFAALRFFIPNPGDNLWLVLATLFGMGIVSGPIAPIPHAMIADVIDFTEWKFARRAEGIISAVTPLGAKVSSGIAGAVPGYVLAWTGYVADAEQTATALAGIAAATSLIPALFIFIGCLATIPYPLTVKVLDQIKQDLQLRKATVEE